MSKWSQKLDAYLTNTSLSKRQLAVKIGISINTLQKWWGDREPSPEYANRISKLLKEGIPTQTQFERQDERPAIVSLLRTVCPFCKHGIEKFKNCMYCGQHFVWANVPIMES